ncbi:MAG: T9SS type A sorting domain-containing protein [Saprospiraceae bacterium]
MKNLTNRLILFVFFFAGVGYSTLWAQAKIPFKPSSANEVMQHLDYRYGNIIQADLFDVYAMLSNELSSNYNSELELPQPNIRYMTPTSVSFHWEHMPSVKHVNVQYFNLRTGVAERIDNIQVDSVILNFLPADPFLFAFQGIGLEDSKGGFNLMLADRSFNFIIVDKDVLRSDIPPPYMLCTCNAGGVVSQHNTHRDLFNTIFVPFTRPCVSTKYNLNITAMTATNEIRYLSLDFVHDQNSYTAPRVHGLNYCTSPTDPDQPYNLGIQGVCETIVTNKGVMVYFNKTTVVEVDFTPSTCNCEGFTKETEKDKRSNSNTLMGALKIKSFPNPADQYTNLSYTLPQDGPVNITLYNPLTQEAQYLKRAAFHTAGAYNFSFPTDQLTAGIYDCVIEVNGKVKTTRIVKIKD